MSTRTTSKAPADYVVASRHPCPKCQGSLNRIPRRTVDRLTSILFPVQRYQCRNFSCRWEGNIRAERD